MLGDGLEFTLDTTATEWLRVELRAHGGPRSIGDCLAERSSSSGALATTGAGERDFGPRA